LQQFPLEEVIIMIYLADEFNLNMLSNILLYTLSIGIKIERLETEDVKAILHNNFVSIIKHKEIAKFLTELLKTRIMVNRAVVKLYPNDKLILFQLMEERLRKSEPTLEKLKQAKYQFLLITILPSKNWYKYHGTF